MSFGSDPAALTRSRIHRITAAEGHATARGVLMNCGIVCNSMVWSDNANTVWRMSVGGKCEDYFPGARTESALNACLYMGLACEMIPSSKASACSFRWQ